nr:sensor histidine kinase [Allomuricauda sp.]
MSVIYDVETIGFVPALAYGLNFTLITVIAVYLHYHKLLPLLFEKRYVLYAILTLCTVTALNIVYMVIDYNLPFSYPMEESYFISYGYNSLSFVLVMIVSSMFYYVREWHLRQEREEHLRMQKLQTELDFLRSQINPHFLFNTLNNIYSYVQTGNEKTAPMIEKLSSILRFMVYDGNNTSVELNKEIDAVESLLEIHRMKNSTQSNIRFLWEGNKGYHLVAPLILINLVENACKHSDAVSNPKGFIHIDAKVIEDKFLQFSISNSVKQLSQKVTAKVGGLGLKNIKKRLSLLYGNNYSITENNDGDVYHLKLKIPLERKK